MNVSIRLAEPADAGAIADIYAAAVVASASSFESDPPTPSEMAARIAKVSSRFPWLVAQVEQRVVGYAYAGDHRTRAAYRWSVETSIYLAESYQRAGIGGRLYRVLFRLLEQLGYVNAYAGMTLPNPGSEALHRRMGFERIGVFPDIGHKFDQWHDVAWWHRRLIDPPPHHPPEPKVPSELLDSADWKSALAESE